MKIGIYSGSFNPIHRGHTALAAYLLRHAGVDEVWLVVSPHNPLKAAETLLSDRDRLQMARLAAEDCPQLVVSDVEFSLPKPSYTVQTLAYLSEKYPEHDFTLMIGADNLAVFDKWKEYSALLRSYRIVVYPRRGFDVDSEAYPQVEYLAGAPLFDVSSTEIRAKIRAGSDVSAFLAPQVHRYLRSLETY